MTKFKPGDHAYHTAGGGRMVVRGESKISSTLVICQWQEQGGFKTGEFEEAALLTEAEAKAQGREVFNLVA